MPFDDFDLDEGAVRPIEGRAQRIAYLEHLMRAIGAKRGVLPPRYELFSGAVLHDLISVSRLKTGVRGAPAFKSLFEVVFGGRHTHIADKTFRNWLDGTSRVDRERVRAFLNVILNSWPEGDGRRFRFCENGDPEGCGEAPPSKTAFEACPICSSGLDKLLNVIFTFNDRPQDEISILPSPGYSSNFLFKFCAQNDLSLVFPLNTANAHNWDEEHFFESFSVIEEFLKLRSPKKDGARLIYVLKPCDPTYTDGESRRQATGEALYRTALERVARRCKHLGRTEISTAIKVLVKAHHISGGPPAYESYSFPERLIIPNNLLDSFPAQSEARKASIQLDRYIQKQMRIQGAKDFQYLASSSTSNPNDIIFYLSCVPERKEDGKWLAARYPLFPLRSLVPGLDTHIQRVIASAAANERDGIAGWQMLGLDHFLSLPLDRTFGPD